MGRRNTREGAQRQIVGHVGALSGQLWTCSSWAIPGTAVSPAKCLPVPPLHAGRSYAADLMWHFVGAAGLLRSS